MPATNAKLKTTSTPDRCTTISSDGRRCTALVYPGHASLCHHHLLQQLDHAPQTEDIASDILSSVENFQSATAINAALGRILTLLAAGRIKRQDAIAMSYICQLMLQSLKGFKQEIRLTRYESLWERDLAKVLFTRTPLQEFIAAPEPESEDSESEESQSEEPQSEEPAQPNSSGPNVVQGFSPAPSSPARENLAPPKPAANPVVSNVAANPAANSAANNVAGTSAACIVQGFSPAPSASPTAPQANEADTQTTAGHKVSPKQRPSRAPAA